MWRNFLIGCLAMLLFACAKPTTLSPALSDAEIQDEQMQQQRIVDAVKAKGGLPKPWKNHKNMRKQFETVGEKIEKAGAEICVAMNLQANGCYFYFTLNRSDELNSHADGKNIVIYTGMMRFVENDDELAVVMAHEFSHNLMGHIKAEKNNATVGMLFGMAVDAIAASQGISTYGTGADIGEDAAVLHYSADFEKEADYVGLYVMAKAGYDISKAPYLWRRMSIENPEDIYNSSTHPSNPERFVAMQKSIYEIEYKRKNKIPLVPDMAREN